MERQRGLSVLLVCGAALWLGLCGANAGEASYYHALKGSYSVQSDANLPVLRDTNTFALLSVVKECSPVGVTNATIHAPGKPPQRLNAGRSELALTRYFNTATQFDSTLPDGTFTYSIQTMGDGIISAPLTVVSNDFPSPHIVNFSSVTNINAEANFTLQWEPFTTGTVDDWIKVTVRDAANNVVFQTAEPLTAGQTGQLTGANTSVVIPADTLTVAQTNYSGEIMFVKVTRNTNSYPGVVGVGGYFRSTTFTLRTMDVRNYGVLKGQVFTQTGPDTLATNGYFFDAFVNSSLVFLTNNLGVNTASFLGPWGTGVFQPLVEPDYYTEEGPYDSIASLNAAYNVNGYPAGGFPNGNHAVKMITRHDGSKTVTGLSLTGDNYPASTPQFSNFASLQSVNAAGDFQITWGPMGGTTNDFIHLEIDTGTNNIVWETPEQGESGSLNGTHTLAVIPAETLTSGVTNYQVYLTFEKHTLNTNSYPGVTGVSGYYKQTIGSLRTVDITGYGLMKSAIYLQTNAGPPLLQRYEFDAFVDATVAANLAGATLQLPSGGPTHSLNITNQFDVNTAYTNIGSLNGSFPSGDYVMSINTTHDGVKTVTNNLPSLDAYPSTTPQIANFAATQGINGGADFTLSWLPISGATTNHYLWVLVNELASQETVFSTRQPGISGALNGTQTSVTIPVGTLRAGYSYLAVIVYGITPPETNGYSGVPGLVGFNNQTHFTFTVPGTAFTKQMQVLGSTNNLFQLKTVGETARPLVLEAASDLTTGFWIPLVTNFSPATGTFTNSLAFPSLNQFYRLRDSSAVGP